MHIPYRLSMSEQVDELFDNQLRMQAYYAVWLTEAAPLRCYSCLQCVGPNRYLFTISYLTISIEPAESLYLALLRSYHVLVYRCSSPSGETMGGIQVPCIE